MVWFGLDGSEFKTINQSMNDKGGHRAARAAKKSTHEVEEVMESKVEKVMDSMHCIAMTRVGRHQGCSPRPT